MKLTLNVEKMLGDCDDLELEFFNFYSEHKTLLGWLLMLNKEEFDIMRNSSISTSFKYPYLKLIADKVSNSEKVTITRSEEALYIKEFNTAVSSIFMVKSGLMTYVAGDTDDEWLFETTEKLKKSYEEIEDYVQEDKNNRRKYRPRKSDESDRYMWEGED